ncbi:hypothetical protein EDB89DRAFT_947150 [Lactarius sanguifluus]|nr:hypothetical protein EDB89DRAFT_947150 [Lactarius sanguifluus]
MTSEHTLPSLAWLTASAIMHIIQFAVSEQASVGSSKMKEHYICLIPKVDCGADVLLLVPGSHDPVGAAASRSRRRGAKWRASGSYSCSTKSDPPHDRMTPDQPLLWYCTGDPFSAFRGLQDQRGAALHCWASSASRVSARPHPRARKVGRILFFVPA